MYLKSLCLATILFSSPTLLYGQEFYFKPEWKQYLDQSDLRSRLAGLYYQDNPLQELISGYFYEVLVAFKDRDRKDLHGRIKFTSFLDISNHRNELRVQKKMGDGYAATFRSINKEDIQFVMLDRRFLFKPLRIREDVYSTSDPDLCFVVINGPICYYFYPQYLSSSDLAFNSNRMHRDMKFFGSEPTSMGGFNFKKNASRLFADYPQLAEKIRQRQEGYKKKNGYEIIVEYNEWVKETDPERFWTYMAR